MGVDYSAHYGIGYKVEAGQSLTDEDLDDGLFEYLDIKIGPDFKVFSSGDECYSGEEGEMFIVIRDPFEHGLDLTKAKSSLDQEIERLRLLTCSKFDVVGGLEVW